MPLYDYQCRKGHITEHLFSVNQKPDLVDCHCGRTASSVLSVPRVSTFEPHYDEFAGMFFESHEDKRRKLKNAGMEEVGGPTEKRGVQYSVGGVRPIHNNLDYRE